MTKIFVNYRRQQEGGWPADSIATRLQSEFGRDHIFLDTKNIRPADEWAKKIRSEIASAAALVVVLGKDWHKVQDEAGNKRLDQKDDWVREEIRTAINLQIPIFILQLDAAELPKKDWLPEDIQPLLDSQAVSIRESAVDIDLGPVLDQLADRTGIP